MKFRAGDLLQSSRHPNYHLFVDSVRDGKYWVWHTYVSDGFGNRYYTKNAGHDSVLTEEFLLTDSSYGEFRVVGYLPALIGQRSIKIKL